MYQTFKANVEMVIFFFFTKIGKSYYGDTTSLLEIVLRWHDFV